MQTPSACSGVEVYKLRIGGKDARKEKFKGRVEVEKFTWNGVQGSFCLVKKDEVCVRVSGF